MPVVDLLAQEYAGRVDVLAVAWASTYDKTAAAAASLLPSGAVRWTLDDAVFEDFEVGYQPVAVLVAGGVEVERWLGGLDEAELRRSLELVTA